MCSFLCCQPLSPTQVSHRDVFHGDSHILPCTPHGLFHPSRLPALPQDLPVYAAGLYIWSLVSALLPGPDICLLAQPEGLTSVPSLDASNYSAFLSTQSRIAGPGPQQLCISLEPALLLKGDVMVREILKMQIATGWGASSQIVS